MCGECGSLDSTWAPVSGRGRVVSWILSRHPNRLENADAVDDAAVVVLVELEEGVRLVSTLVGAGTEGPFEGLDVAVAFDEVDDATIPVFNPVA
jgi:uncharacterized OB-fold protein